MLVCPNCGSTYTRSLEFCGLDGGRLYESEVDPLVGRTIDRYRVVETIGSGGMARVYRATHVFLEQDFAIKVLHGQIAADKSFATRFHREATALGKIKHRNVVQVSDFGATKEGLLFLVMEYLDGPSLTEALRRSGPFSPQRSAALARQLALGLGAAHSRGFVHRDLKPGNIILMEEDGVEVPKILDFGLVRLLEPDDAMIPTQLTAHGQMFGTPAYMSPEQISGEDIDSRADLYSLGVILYQMIVGSTPFTGEVGELVKQHVSVAPQRPRFDHGGLTSLAMKLLEKDPVDRLQSAAEVVDAIDELGLIDNVSHAPARRVSEPRPYVGLDVETRNDRTPQLDDEISIEIERSARDALGFRAYGGWVLGVGLLALIAFIGWVADRQGLVSRHFAPPPPITEVQPEPQPVLPPDPPPPAQPEKKQPAAVLEPKAEPIDPPPPEPKPEAPPARPAPRAHHPTASFYDLDSSLAWTLSSRGLSFEDLAEVETEAAWKWAKWSELGESPPHAELAAAYEKLSAVARGLVIDRDLLESKLARARIAISKFPEAARGVRHEVLIERADQLEEAVRAQPFRDPVERIAAEITLLESDVDAALAESALSEAIRTGTSSTGS
jgi:serine/threonine-protein kinase